MSDAIGFPNFVLGPKAAFNTFMNCSYQSELEESDQLISAFAKFKLLLSMTFSLVDTATTFSKPFAH